METKCTSSEIKFLLGFDRLTTAEAKERVRQMLNGRGLKLENDNYEISSLGHGIVIQVIPSPVIMRICKLTGQSCDRGV